MDAKPIQFSPPDIREEDIEAVVEVLRSGWITTGPVAQAFEREIASYTGAGGAVLVNSCTAGLELALRLLGVGPGDEVIVPAYTYTASAAVVRHVGATLVLVDSEEGEYTPSVETILEAVTPNTAAIIVVDLAGVPFDAARLRQGLEGVGVRSDNPLLTSLGRPAVIADSAHSLGAWRGGRRAGALADLSAFSFHAVKNLTTAEGGALVWRPDLPFASEELARAAKLTALHGQSKDALTKMQAGAWEYDITELGHKWNMPDVLAALGLSQLSRYDEMIRRRHEIVELYDALLPEGLTSLPHHGEGVRSSGHLYMVDLGDRSGSREDIIQALAAEDVAANVHYKPLPLLTAYRELGFDPADFPNAVDAYRRELTLPLHTLLSDRDVERVTGVLEGAL